MWRLDTNPIFNELKLPEEYDVFSMILKNVSFAYNPLVLIKSLNVWFILWCATSNLTHWNSIVLSGEEFPDKKPKVQLVISYEDAKLTILVKHMKNIVSLSYLIRNM